MSSNDHEAIEQAIDPVCGMTVTNETAAGSFEHEGRTYLFCSPHCLEVFRRDPERFIKGTPPQTIQISKPVLIGKGEYTCPMHPEIVRDGPGSCPISGKALEPRTVSLEEEENPELVDMTRRFLTGVILTTPLLLIAMSDLIPGRPLERIVSMQTVAWIELVLATPVVLWSGWPFFVRAWQSIVSRNLNMFTLIGLGVAVAYVYSLIAKLFPNIFPDSFRENGDAVPVYFEAAAVITTLVLLGQVLELKARGRTGAASKALLGLAPKTARRIRDDGTEEDV